MLAGLPRRTGEQAKASALLVARGITGRTCQADEAEAVCIARWAESSAEVALAVAKAARKRKRLADSGDERPRESGHGVNGDVKPPYAVRARPTCK
jgi:hypothetical protein